MNDHGFVLKTRNANAQVVFSTRFFGATDKKFSSKGVEKLQTAFLHNEAISQKNIRYNSIQRSIGLTYLKHGQR